jgi:hypothetical protein
MPAFRPFAGRQLANTPAPPGFTGGSWHTLAYASVCQGKIKVKKLQVQTQTTQNLSLLAIYWRELAYAGVCQLSPALASFFGHLLADSWRTRWQRGRV